MGSKERTGVFRGYWKFTPDKIGRALILVAIEDVTAKRS